MGVYNDDVFLCGICHRKIEPDELITQDKTYFSVVCINCHNTFPEKDIGLIIGLFISYGGYFGKLRNSASDFDLRSLIIESTGNLQIKEIRLLLMHVALLYGITPDQFNNMLELLRT